MKLSLADATIAGLRQLIDYMRDIVRLEADGARLVDGIC